SMHVRERRARAQRGPRSRQCRERAILHGPPSPTVRSELIDHPRLDRLELRVADAALGHQGLGLAQAFGRILVRLGRLVADGALEATGFCAQLLEFTLAALFTP